MNPYKFSIKSDLGGYLDSGVLLASLTTAGLLIDRIDTLDDDGFIYGINKDFTDDEAKTISIAISGHGLQVASAVKFAEIDAKTGALIAQGYEFGGKKMSLSLPAQITLLGLSAAENDLTYPVEINTLNDADVLVIPDATTAHNVFLTAVGTYRAWKDQGTDLKNQIRSAKSTADIDVVKDLRK